MTENRTSKCTGLGLIGWIASIPLVLIALLILAVGFFEARKAYWDHKVTAMCKNDGGITVFESVILTQDNYKQLGGTQGGLPLPNKRNATKDHPYFYDTRTTTFREWSPKVARSETIIKRQSDGKILGRSVRYWRRGGDFPTGLLQDSSFICPEKSALSTQVFNVGESSK